MPPAALRGGAVDPTTLGSAYFQHVVWAVLRQGTLPLGLTTPPTSLQGLLMASRPGSPWSNPIGLPSKRRSAGMLEDKKSSVFS
jgi:hypothetical protein